MNQVHNLRRVMLDTNIVLTGALSSQSQAGQLHKRSDSFSFYVPTVVLDEARSVIRKNTNRRDLLTACPILIDNFLKKMHAVIIESGGSLFGNDIDKTIYELASKNVCEFLCTYNIKHFPSNNIKVLSPLSLGRLAINNELTDFLPYYSFGAKWTVLFSGILHHTSSLGEIIDSANSLKVFLDEEGVLQVIGRDVKRFKIIAHLPLKNNHKVFLLFRYSKGDFETRNWDFDSNSWLVLSKGKADFIAPISPKVGSNGKTSAIISDFSAIPIFVKNKDLSIILQNECLEASIGSKYIGELLNKIKINLIAPDEWQVSF